jgi:hypothetical protein
MALKIAGMPLRKRVDDVSVQRHDDEPLGIPLETLPMPDASAASNDDHVDQVKEVVAVLDTPPRSGPVDQGATSGGDALNAPEPVYLTENHRRFGDNWDPETDSYINGRNRAPEHSRIKPGEIRNPKGRGKGTKNRATLLREALDTKVAVTIKGRRRHMSHLELSYRALGAKAAKGDLKAIELAERLSDKLLGPDNDEQRIEEPLTEAELAVLKLYQPARGSEDHLGN